MSFNECSAKARVVFYHVECTDYEKITFHELHMNMFEIVAGFFLENQYLKYFLLFEISLKQLANIMHIVLVFFFHSFSDSLKTRCKLSSNQSRFTSKIKSKIRNKYISVVAPQV